MDDLVKLGLAKWPKVPACYGWLALDRRGQWRIGDERQVISNAAIASFINRNYLSDKQGRWLFQNGPQRVFVSLDYTPYVWRLLPGATGWCLTDHTGHTSTQTPTLWLDTDGHFLIQADERIGVLHDHDSALLAEWFCDAQGQTLDEAAATSAIETLQHGGDEHTHRLWLRWLNQQVIPVHGIDAYAVAQRFGFVAQPEADAESG